MRSTDSCCSRVSLVSNTVFHFSGKKLAAPCLWPKDQQQDEDGHEQPTLPVIRNILNTAPADRVEL